MKLFYDIPSQLFKFLIRFHVKTFFLYGFLGYFCFADFDKKFAIFVAASLRCSINYFKIFNFMRNQELNKEKNRAISSLHLIMNRGDRGIFGIG